MTLVDTANGILMAYAYAWAGEDPAQKLLYNLLLTLLSALVALAVGLIEALGVVQHELGLGGTFWSMIANVNEHFELLGYGVIGLFALAFLVGVIAVRRVPRVQRVTPTEALQKYVAEGNFIDRSGME